MQLTERENDSGQLPAPSTRVRDCPPAHSTPSSQSEPGFPASFCAPCLAPGRALRTSASLAKPCTPVPAFRHVRSVPRSSWSAACTHWPLRGCLLSAGQACQHRRSADARDSPSVRAPTAATATSSGTQGHRDPDSEATADGRARGGGRRLDTPLNPPRLPPRCLRRRTGCDCRRRTTARSAPDLFPRRTAGTPADPASDLGTSRPLWPPGAHAHLLAGFDSFGLEAWEGAEGVARVGLTPPSGRGNYGEPGD